MKHLIVATMALALTVPAFAATATHKKTTAHHRTHTSKHHVAKKTAHHKTAKATSHKHA